jgi:hypothetical protein
MSTAHTWTRAKAQGSHWSNLICEGSEIVATVNGTGYPTGIGWSPVSERRAQLIEAAPDMLAALEYAADKLIAAQCAETDDQEMRIIDNINQVIRAAIAKATGEETNA